MPLTMQSSRQIRHNFPGDLPEHLVAHAGHHRLDQGVHQDRIRQQGLDQSLSLFRGILRFNIKKQRLYSGIIGIRVLLVL